MIRKKRLTFLLVGILAWGIQNSALAEDLRSATAPPPASLADLVREAL